MNRTSTILLVDDHAANRETLRELLGEPAYQFVEAANGATALQRAAEVSPDLVLLDVMMPGMDGFEVCRRLRADPRLAAVPVIMVTALDDQASRLAGIEAGADDFITKPFNRVELRARTRTITRLNRYRRLHEQREQFQWVVEHAADGYVLTNAVDEIIFANARARLWLDLPPGNGAEPVREKFLVAARRNFSGEPAARWQDWPAAGSGVTDAPRLLVRPESAGARASFIEVSVRANADGWLLRLTDITERMAAHREQRSFQKMVSHKLRTPLNALHGGLEMLSEPESLSREETAEFIGIARAGAARLLGAVADVLRFAAQSQQATPKVGFTLDRLDGLVRSVATSLDLTAVALDIADDAREADIACTPETLEWVLFELLENTKKFHPRGIPQVRVAASRDLAGSVCLSVSDDGLTLPPEQLAQAGTPFYQGEKYFTGEVSGMGLGLASVSVALWQSGGSCQLRNRRDGPGVCVELKWPGVSNTRAGGGMVDASQYLAD